MAPEPPRSLEVACAGSPELRAELESLLRAHEDAGAFIERFDAKRGAVLVVGTNEAGDWPLVGEVGPASGVAGPTS